MSKLDYSPVVKVDSVAGKFGQAGTVGIKLETNPKLIAKNRNESVGANNPLTLNYQASTGVTLQTEAGKTTTILGSYNKDMAAIVNELGNVKSMDFGPKPGGFNVLNAPDELFTKNWGQRGSGIMSMHHF